MNVESKVNAEWTFKMLFESSVSLYGVVQHMSVGSVSPHKVLCKHGCALIDRLFPVCRFDSSCTLNGLLTNGLEQCWRFIIANHQRYRELPWAGGCDIPSQYLGCSQYHFQIFLRNVRGHSAGYQTIFGSCRQNLFRFGFVWMSAELNIWNVI